LKLDELAEDSSLSSNKPLILTYKYPFQPLFSTHPVKESLRGRLMLREREEELYFRGFEVYQRKLSKTMSKYHRTVEGYFYNYHVSFDF
jgi:hypothetical protein